MSDLLALTTVITSVSSLVELAKNIKNSELQKKIAELNLQIANVQNEIASLIRENGKLNKELIRVKYENKNPLNYNRDDGLYYDDEPNAPYCPRCYEVTKKRVHIIQYSMMCPECETYYREKGFGAAGAGTTMPKYRI